MYFHSKYHCLSFIQHVSICSLSFWECCLKHYKLHHCINKFGFIPYSVKRRRKTFLCVPGPVNKTLPNLEGRLNWTSYTLSISSWAAMALNIAGIPTAASRGRAHSTPMEGPVLCRLSDGQRRRPLGFSDPGCLRAGKASLLLRTQFLWVWAKSQSWVSSRLRPQAWGRLWRLPSHLVSPQWWGWVLGRGAGQLPGSAGWSVSSTVPCILRAVPWFLPHFPCQYVNKMYFSQGCVDSGGPTMPRQRGWVFCCCCCCCCCCCSRFKIVLREKSCHKYGGTGVTFSLEVKTPNVDSQDLLEESAGTHSPSPAGSRARGKNTMCPPHHTCFYNFQWVFFPQQCCSRWKQLKTWQVLCVRHLPLFECSILFLRQNLLQLSFLVFVGRNLINDILKTY